MPLGYFRRPLFLLLAAYMALLAGLRAEAMLFARASDEGNKFYRSLFVEAIGIVAAPAAEGRRGERVVIRIERVEQSSADAKMLVFLPRGEENRCAEERLAVGEKVRVVGRLRRPRAPKNPGDFDEVSFLSDRGVAWVMEASTFAALSPAPRRYALLNWADAARRSLEETFRRRLPPEEAELAKGLVLGFRPIVRPELLGAIQDAGAIHLVVPSGAKVATVLVLSLALARLLTLRPGARWALAAILAGFYTLMVGAEPPYARAYLMALIVGACLLGDRDPGLFQALLISAWIILIVHPSDLFATGFQMTYLASFGLVLAWPSVGFILPSRGIVRHVAAAALATLIVEIMLWPVFACVFGRGSLVAPAANMVLAPASAVVMALGFALWLADIWGGGSGLLARALSAAIAAFRWACFKFAAVPWAAVSLAPMNARAIVLYYLVVLAVLVLPRWKSSLFLGAAALAFFCGGRLAGAAAAPRWEVLLLRLRAPCAVAAYSDGQVWAIDAPSAGALARVLRARGIARLDKIVITSCERERWAGLARLAARVPARELEFPAQLRREAEFRKALLAWARRGTVLSARRTSAYVLRCGEIVFDFGGAGPRVLRGESEYSIIPSRLKVSAVSVRTDGHAAEITNAER